MLVDWLGWMVGWLDGWMDGWMDGQILYSEGKDIVTLPWLMVFVVSYCVGSERCLFLKISYLNRIFVCNIICLGLVSLHSQMFACNIICLELVSLPCKPLVSFVAKVGGDGIASSSSNPTFNLYDASTSDMARLSYLDQYMPA